MGKVGGMLKLAGCGEVTQECVGEMMTGLGHVGFGPSSVTVLMHSLRHVSLPRWASVASPLN